MTEIDLRKLPLHRKFEAYENICMLHFQEAYIQKKLTKELMKKIRKEVWEDMDYFELNHNKRINVWMDFGEEFIQVTGVNYGRSN